MSDELFQLSNGRYITSEDISRKLYYIKDHHPETAYQDDSTGYSWDEAGMADLFSECYQNDTRYCPEAKSWYTYETGKWHKDVGALLVSAKIKEFVRLMALYCGEITDEEKDYFETPEAMRGIFTWLVAGYFKYIRFGLKMSQGMQKVIKQYEKDNDLVLQFLEEKCERNAEGKTRAKSLYDNYKMWCKGNGYYVCSMKKFNAELTAHPEWYADKAVTQGVLFYYGVALRQN